MRKTPVLGACVFCLIAAAGCERRETRLDVNASAAALTTWPTPAAWTPQLTSANGLALGDVNGDGYDDVIVGDALFFGGRDGPDSKPVWSSAAGILYPTLVDVDADGFADLLFSRSSGSYLPPFFARGSSQGLGQAERLDLPHSPFLVSAGDVDGDGFGDVLGLAQHGDNFASAAYLFRGSDNGLIAEPAWTAVPEPSVHDTNALFTAVGGGDIDGDGFADVAIGQSKIGAESVMPIPDRVFVYMGSKTGLSAEPARRIDAAPTIAPLADVNGDGFADLVVAGGGATQVYLGSRDGLASEPASSSNFGPALVTGDFNGDRFDDVLLVAQGLSSASDSADAPRPSKVSVVFGSAAGLAATPALAKMWSAPDVFAASGDVNGDGFDDIAIAIQPESGAASALVYLGAPDFGSIHTATSAARDAGDAVIGDAGAVDAGRVTTDAGLHTAAHGDQPDASTSDIVHAQGCGCSVPAGTPSKRNLALALAFSIGAAVRTRRRGRAVRRI